MAPDSMKMTGMLVFTMIMENILRKTMGHGKALAAFTLSVAPIVLTLVLVVLLGVNPLAAMGGVTGGEPPSPGLLALAFGSGFAGVMLSPVHLCLVLTREYFNADMARVYNRLWLPSALVLAAGMVPLFLIR
ncbi:MAG TPA: DUF401 family protein [Geobacteraceae bacterium]|nr:DUF401 family protein [Geobacteraceae bacterium]